MTPIRQTLDRAAQSEAGPSRKIFAAKALMAAALALFLVACGGGDGKADKNANGGQGSEDGIVTLNRGNGSEPNTLDPHQANGTWENNIIGDMILGLFTEDAYGNPTFGAAVDHQISEDGLTHTFKLREGAVWSDGEPVTAHDFVFAWKRILDPNTAAPYASLIYVFKNGRAINEGEMPVDSLGARAIDDLTLELQVEKPVPFIRTLMTHYTTWPVPKHLIEEVGDAWVKPGTMVSNGAYVLQEWRPNSRLVLVKNDKFWDADNVAIDKVVYTPNGDVSAALRAFRAGELDVNSCSQCYPIQQIGFINKNMPGVVRNELVLATTYIAFNTTKPPYDDVRIRRALSLALDRETMVTKVLRSGEVPAYAFVPPTIQNYVSADELPHMAEASMTQEERNALAMQLLAEAGYDADNPLKIEVKYRLAGDRKQIMVAMQNMWRQIGVEAELIGAEPKVAYADYRSRNFEVADAGWVADYNDPDNFLFLMKGDTGPLNYSDYKNEEFDRLLNEANSMLDLEARAKVMAKAEQIMLNDMAVAPIYFSVNRNLVGLHVQNWNDNSQGIQRTRWLSIDESKRVSY